ncbi:MAG: hypothetical protein WBA63_13155 [Thermomicrobiales bacterium]
MTIVQPPVWDQSHNIQHDDKYWRKYLSAISGENTEQLRFAAYACRQWNAAHTGDTALAQIRLYKISARTLPDNKQADSIQRQTGTYRCL